MVISRVDVESYLEDANGYLKGKKSKPELYEAIVNAPFRNRRIATTLGLGFLSFVLVNKKKGTIDRIAISKTDTAQGAIDITIKPFHELIIPLNHKGNFVVDAVKTGRYQQTSDWYYLLTPVLKPEEARLNQAGAGIASSFVYPLKNAPVGGAIIFQYFIPLDKIGLEQRDFMFRYAKKVSQALNKVA